MNRLDQLRDLGITLDEVLELFSREQLLSALGFDRTSDHLDVVPIADAVNYYGESALIEFFDISDYWDAESAYDRYGSDLLDFFSGYSYTDDWSCSDYIANYGDLIGMLEELLTYSISTDEVYACLRNMQAEDYDKLAKLMTPPKSPRVEMLEAFLKAQRI